MDTCLICQQFKQLPKASALGTFSTTTCPGEVISLDFKGPLPLSPKQNRYILTIVDHTSRWAVGLPCGRPNAWVVVEGVKLWSPVFKKPSIILCDGAQALHHVHMENYCHDSSIQLVATPL